jgi:hypothetical protein
MSARKTKPMRGTPKEIRDFHSKRDQARAVLCTDFEEIRLQCDRVDRCIKNLLVDLAEKSFDGVPEMLADVARIQSASFIIGNVAAVRKP